MPKRKNQAIGFPRFDQLSDAAERCVLIADKILAWAHHPDFRRWYVYLKEGHSAVDPRLQIQLLLEAFAPVSRYLSCFERGLAKQSVGVPPTAYGLHGTTSHEVAGKLAEAVLEAVARTVDSELVVGLDDRGVYRARVLGWEQLMNVAACDLSRPVKTTSGLPSAPSTRPGDLCEALRSQLASILLDIPERLLASIKLERARVRDILSDKSKQQGKTGAAGKATRAKGTTVDEADVTCRELADKDPAFKNLTALEAAEKVRKRLGRKTCSADTICKTEYWKKVTQVQERDRRRSRANGGPSPDTLPVNLPGDSVSHDQYEGPSEGEDYFCSSEGEGYSRGVSHDQYEGPSEGEDYFGSSEDEGYSRYEGPSEGAAWSVLGGLVDAEEERAAQRILDRAKTTGCLMQAEDGDTPDELLTELTDEVPGRQATRKEAERAIREAERAIRKSPFPAREQSFLLAAMQDGRMSPDEVLGVLGVYPRPPGASKERHAAQLKRDFDASRYIGRPPVPRR